MNADIVNPVTLARMHNLAYEIQVSHLS